MKKLISILLISLVPAYIYAQTYDITPDYPYNYAIVPSTNITFKAVTSDSLAPALNYFFELDTTDAFNSPELMTQTINHTGGVVTWAPLLPITTDSIVYFWRVSLDATYYGTFNWHESSFQYITGAKGWGQAHFYQFKNDSLHDIIYNKPGRLFEFVKDPIHLQAQTGIYPNLPWNEEWYKLNDSVMDIWSCLGDIGNGMTFAVFNPISGKPWYSHQIGNTGGGQYGDDNTSSIDLPAFDFFTDYPPASALFRHRITHFIDTVPDGYYILAYSHRNHFAEEYETDLYQAFESFGSASISVIQDNTPYIIFGKKGGPIGSAHEVIGSAQQIITLTDSMPVARTKGYIKSELIGPAVNWHSLHWRVRSVDPYLTDSVVLYVLGIKLNGGIDTLMQIMPPSLNAFDINGLETTINSTFYPYLKLVAVMQDTTFRTPYQLVRWQVLYDPLPDFLSINELTVNNEMGIYPNPATNDITIECPQASTIEIMNFAGQIIKTLSTTSNQTSIDISDFAKGIYFIKVLPITIGTEKGVMVEKFVKE